VNLKTVNYYLIFCIFQFSYVHLEIWDAWSPKTKCVWYSFHEQSLCFCAHWGCWVLHSYAGSPIDVNSVSIASHELKVNHTFDHALRWRHLMLRTMFCRFALAFVDCSSSVTFLPFMTIFPNTFLTTYFFGEGLSGLFPSVFALAQGAGDSACLNVSHFNSTTNTTTYSREVVATQPRYETLFCG